MLQLIMMRPAVVLQVGHFFLQFMLKYRVRCWMLVAGIETCSEKYFKAFLKRLQLKEFLPGYGGGAFGIGGGAGGLKTGCVGGMLGCIGYGDGVGPG